MQAKKEGEKMTYEEALKEIQHQVYRNTDNAEMRISKECYKKIISAFEKQTPKKPCYDNTFAICPSCHDPIFKDDFCEHCGQKIDWSRENDK